MKCVLCFSLATHAMPFYIFPRYPFRSMNPFRIMLFDVLGWIRCERFSVKPAIVFLAPLLLLRGFLWS